MPDSSCQQCAGYSMTMASLKPSLKILILDMWKIANEVTKYITNACKVVRLIVVSSPALEIKTHVAKRVCC
jgi:hypothetical protein